MIPLVALTFATIGVVLKPLEIAQAVAARERKIFISKDYKAYERLLTADFVSIGPTGNRLDKRVAIDRQRMIFATIVKIKSIDSTVLSVRRAEGGVLVGKRSVLVAFFRTKGPQPVLEALYQRSESLLVRKGNDWLIKRTHILSSHWTKGDRRNLV